MFLILTFLFQWCFTCLWMAMLYSGMSVCLFVCMLYYNFHEHRGVKWRLYPSPRLVIFPVGEQLSVAYQGRSGPMDNGLSRAPPHTLYPYSVDPSPHIHPYSDFAHVYLYMILNTALFNQYTSHGVFWKFGSLWWRDKENGAPWWRNDKWGTLDNVMGN